MKIIGKKIYVIICVFLIAVIIGLVKVNIINTKALSPLGNSKENYEKIRESFGDEFSNFINDNSLVKIYKEDASDDILVRIGEKNFKVRKQSYLIGKVKEVGEFIGDIYDTLIE